MRSLAQLCAWKLSLHGAPVEGIVGAGVRRRRPEPLPPRRAGALQPHLRPPRRRHDVVPGQRALRAAARSCAAARPALAGPAARNASATIGVDRRRRALRPRRPLLGLRAPRQRRRRRRRRGRGPEARRGRLGDHRPDAHGRRGRLGGARPLAADGRRARAWSAGIARAVDGRHGDPADQRPHRATAAWAPGRRSCWRARCGPPAIRSGCSSSARGPAGAGCATARGGSRRAARRSARPRHLAAGPVPRSPPAPTRAQAAPIVVRVVRRRR